MIRRTDKYKVHNASEQLRGKFVFCSPSITTATDFSIETPQDVFIYIKGGNNNKRRELPTGNQNKEHPQVILLL